MEVKVISQEYIKPSSPTPPNLKTYKLSLLDQAIPSIYIPLILFYPTNRSTNHAAVDILSERSHLLKQSLSQTLSLFYPFAGKIRDSLSIDCNDEGVFYLEARANCHLVDFLSQPNLASLENFFPQEFAWKDPTVGDHVAMVKLTGFACGGIAISVLICHMIGDGTAASVFLKSWAATIRMACEPVCPNFDAPSIFIQNSAYSREADRTTMYKFLKTGRCSVRRIVFDASAIASLQAKSTSTSVQHPTRIEAVTTLLWKCTMNAFKATSGVQRPTCITHSVNLRRRAYPHFTDSSMGNLLWIAGVLCMDEEKNLPCMVSKLREALSKINADFVKNLQGDGGFSKLCELVKETMSGVSNIACPSGMDYIAFTSWCHLGFYDIDFGWGKPMWVSTVGSRDDMETVFPCSVVLMDARSCGGIEAWVRLDKKDMTMLVQDKELLAFASIDPSPRE